MVLSCNVLTFEVEVLPPAGRIRFSMKFQFSPLWHQVAALLCAFLPSWPKVILLFQLRSDTDHEQHGSCAAE